MYVKKYLALLADLPRVACRFVDWCRTDFPQWLGRSTLQSSFPKYFFENKIFSSTNWLGQIFWPPDFQSLSLGPNICRLYAFLYIPISQRDDSQNFRGRDFGYILDRKLIGFSPFFLQGGTVRPRSHLICNLLGSSTNQIRVVYQTTFLARGLLKNFAVNARLYSV